MTEFQQEIYDWMLVHIESLNDENCKSFHRFCYKESNYCFSEFEEAVTEALTQLGLCGDCELVKNDLHRADILISWE
jgi:hypothetical protein